MDVSGGHSEMGCVFFIKQKTADEWRISDWSSDVCSSDLTASRWRESKPSGRRPTIACASAVPRPKRTRPPRKPKRPDSAWTSSVASRPTKAESGAGKSQAIKNRRSEEHTSELQSLMRISYAVFCLKKKKQQTQAHKTTKHLASKR